MSEHEGKKLFLELTRSTSLICEGEATVDEGDLELIASYVSDLESRMEKAEAERDQLVEQQIAVVNDLQTARADALEEAAYMVTDFDNADWVCWGENRNAQIAENVSQQIALAIRALKSSPPPPDGEAA